MNIQTVHNADSNTYMVTLSGGAIFWVPKDPLNADYIRVQAWVAAGGAVS